MSVILHSFVFPNVFQVGISNRREDLICTKLSTWWYYISLFGPSVKTKVDDVVEPFLKFCFGSPDSQILQDSAAVASPVKVSGEELRSPAKRYSTVRARCLEATAVLIAGVDKISLTR